MHKVMMFVVAVALMGCGGGLDERFDGLWKGTAQMTEKGNPANTFSYSATVELHVDGNTLTASRLCPDSSGTLSLEGEGYEASWTGALECPLPTSQCPTMLLRYSKGTIRLSQVAREVSLHGEGAIVGCGANIPVNVTFYGGPTR